MNNKGQTLVLFIIILPILLILVALLINYGFLSSSKLKIENNVKDAIEYGLNLKMNNSVVGNLTLSDNEIKNRIENLLNQNIDYKNLEVIINTNSISVTVIQENKKIFNILDAYKTIKVSYYGTITDGKILIEER